MNLCSDVTSVGEYLLLDALPNGQNQQSLETVFIKQIKNTDMEVAKLK